MTGIIIGKEALVTHSRMLCYFCGFRGSFFQSCSKHLDAGVYLVFVFTLLALSSFN